MGILDKLDKFIPGHKERESRKDAFKERDNEMRKMEEYQNKVESSNIYKSYMDDEFNDMVEAGDLSDFISGLLSAAIANSDRDAIAYFANDLDGDFDLKDALEDIDDKELYDFIISLHKNPDQWLRDTNINSRESLGDSLIYNANNYL